MTYQRDTQQLQAEFRMFVPDDDGSAMDWFENTIDEERCEGIAEGVLAGKIQALHIMEDCYVKARNKADLMDLTNEAILEKSTYWFITDSGAIHNSNKKQGKAYQHRKMMDNVFETKEAAQNKLNELRNCF